MRTYWRLSVQASLVPHPPAPCALWTPTLLRENAVDPLLWRKQQWAAWTSARLFVLAATAPLHPLQHRWASSWRNKRPLSSPGPGMKHPRLFRPGRRLPSMLSLCSRRPISDFCRMIFEPLSIYILLVIGHPFAQPSWVHCARRWRGGRPRRPCSPQTAHPEGVA